jgi:hypothetical protein
MTIVIMKIVIMKTKMKSNDMKKPAKHLTPQPDFKTTLLQHLSSPQTLAQLCRLTKRPASFVFQFLWSLQTQELVEKLPTGEFRRKNT